MGRTRRGLDGIAAVKGPRFRFAESVLSSSESQWHTVTTVDYTVDSNRATALVTLDRPDSLHALNDRMVEELCDVIGRAETDHVHAVWECDKPVIAAVDGYCLAGGSDLAMACNMVIAPEESEFGYPGLRMAGVPPTLVSPFVINLHEAKELLLSGKIVDSQRAAVLGMVNRIVARDRLMDAVFTEIDEIRKMPGNNVRILKHVLNGVAEMQGAKPMFKYGELFDALSHHTEYGKKYYRIAATKEGFGAALST